MRAGNLGCPGFGRVRKVIVKVIDLDGLILLHRQQAPPDCLAVGGRALSGADARQGAEEEVADIQVHDATRARADRDQASTPFGRLDRRKEGLAEDEIQHDVEALAA